MSQPEAPLSSETIKSEPCNVDLLNNAYKACAALQFNRWKYPEKSGGQAADMEECTESFEAWKQCYIEKMTKKKA
jgi:hypothetical protein